MQIFLDTGLTIHFRMIYTLDFFFLPTHYFVILKFVCLHRKHRNSWDEQLKMKTKGKLNQKDIHSSPCKSNCRKSEVPFTLLSCSYHPCLISFAIHLFNSDVLPFIFFPPYPSPRSKFASVRCLGLVVDAPLRAMGIAVKFGRLFSCSH